MPDKRCGIMHYGEIKNYDIANGTGVRVSLFVSGCRNMCRNCFQPETWDFEYGNVFTSETWKEIFEMVKPDYIKGLTVLGGEPFEPENQRGIYPFLEEFVRRFPDKSIWIYTGFTLEELKDENSRARCEVTDGILGLIDVLVDGRFEEEKKNISLQFRGSENQRIIDMKLTEPSGNIVLWNENRGQHDEKNSHH